MKEVVDLLISKEKTISSMESCTGGYFVNEITNIKDASKVLSFSAITYSNEFKIKMGVSKDIIDKYSVYSMETAKEMSKSISLFTSSTYGVGITGKLKKIDESNLYSEDDLVFVSVYDSENKIYYNKKIRVTENVREKNKKMIVKDIIKMLLEILNS